MNSKLVICAFLLISLFANAQNKAIDSLNSLLKTSKSEIKITQLLNQIADEYKIINPKEMIDYASKALQLSQKNNFKIEEGNAYHHIGNANVILGNYETGLDNFLKEQTIFESELKIKTLKNQIDLKNGLARAYGSIGFIFTEQGDYLKALQNNFKALKIFEETNSTEKILKINNNIGVIYNTQGKYRKALVYYEKALKIQKEKNDKSIGITTTNIGLCYFYLKNNSKALEYYKMSEYYFVKFPNPRGLGELYNNYGTFYFERNDEKLAIEYLTKALKIFESIEDKFGSADTYATLGSIYLKQNKYNLSITNINKSLQLGKEIGALYRVQDSEKDLSTIYEKLNNTTEALKHYKLYTKFKDSITNTEIAKNSIKAELNFEFDRKQILQKAEQEKKEIYIEAQKRSEKIKIFVGVLFLSSVSGIAFLIYKRRQLRKRLTLEKELAVYEQKALHLQMNPHFIFNCLGSISSFIVQNSTDAAIKYLAKFSKLMRLTLEYSKETLIPIDKEIESLQNYLELEQLRFNNKFDFSINKAQDIDDDVALPPLLLQPFVENSIIHGLNTTVKNGSITVDFSINDESLICIIKDNGIGIDKSKESKKQLVTMHKSMALNITNKRLEMMETSTTQRANVKLEEMNEDGEILGTKVTLVLPLQYSKS
ncbi:tetratricopeptide repeat protein [Flavobacterium sp.]|uniref:tetratricopeptide repeat-containing sensor histidine kinase n=1 Tax=Flavobacterium sp. TaxID=239 RepID=UPI003750FE9C